MLEIDFPYSDSNWPNSRKRAGEVLADVPDDECPLLVEENARRMLNFPWVSADDPPGDGLAPSVPRTRSPCA